MYNVFRMCLQYYPSLFIFLYLYAKIVGRIRRHDIDTKVTNYVINLLVQLELLTIRYKRKGYD